MMLTHDDASSHGKVLPFSWAKVVKYSFTHKDVSSHGNVLHFSLAKVVKVHN